MSLNTILPMLLAGLSAIGNAMFAFGQKRADVADNPFIFLILTLITCICLFCITIPFLPRTNTIAYLHKNYCWVLISGIGFYLTFIGFYFLYTTFGTSYYVLYAVFSILTTSILVGVVVFKESFNIYHLLSVICAIATVILFSIGYKMSRGS